MSRSRLSKQVKELLGKLRISEISLPGVTFKLREPQVRGESQILRKTLVELRTLKKILRLKEPRKRRGISEIALLNKFAKEWKKAQRMNYLLTLITIILGLLAVGLYLWK